MGHRMTRTLVAAALLALLGAPAWAQGFSPVGTCATHQWNYAYGSMTTAADCLQPGFGDISGTLATSQLPAFGAGDVSFAAGGGAGTIAANAVTNAKLAQAGAYTIKGNNTGSTANEADISVGAWSTYTPVLTCSSGLVSAATTAGRYQQIGKTVTLWVSVNITSLGTCGVNFYVTVPSTNPQSLTPLMVYDSSVGAEFATAQTSGIIVFGGAGPEAHQYYATGVYEAQ